jgi:hypothetical protein
MPPFRCSLRCAGSRSLSSTGLMTFTLATLRSRYIRTNTDRRRRRQSLVNIGVSLKADDVKRLRELERENSTLKRLLAKAELEKAALKEIAKEEF